MISAKQPLKIPLLNFLVGGQLNFFASSKCQIYKLLFHFGKQCQISKLHANLNFWNFLSCFLSVYIHSFEGANSGVQHGSGRACYRLRPPTGFTHHWITCNLNHTLNKLLIYYEILVFLAHWCFELFQRLISTGAWCILYLLFLVSGLLLTSVWNQIIFSKLSMTGKRMQCDFNLTISLMTNSLNFNSAHLKISISLPMMGCIKLIAKIR